MFPLHPTTNYELLSEPDPEDLEFFELDPESPDPEVLDSEELDPESLEPVLELSVLDTFFFFPDLKSVSYQPAPFRRNPAAEIFFTKLSLSQFGHVFNRFSLSFWMASSS